MGFVDTQVRTLSCDAFGCNKQLVFDHKDAQKISADPANAWLKSHRVVQTVDQRVFVYCSDECELKGTATGKHNLPEPKQVVEGNAAAVAIAAQAAAAAKQAEETLRSGAGGKITVTDN